MGKVCCFLGHRKIIETNELKSKLYETIEGLITDKNTETFLFGSKSRFKDLCYAIVSDLKKRYPNVVRIYVRAEFPVITDSYKAYLLKMYEDTYYPQKITGSGKATYVERNFVMIDQSQFCVFYYDEKLAPTNRKSGTKIALDYAVKRKKEIITVQLQG